MSNIKMTAVDCGPLELDHGKIVAFSSGEVTIPTTVGIFVHEQHGVILWDTGCNHAVSEPDGPEAYWGEGIKTAFGAHGFTRDMAIDRRLDALGIKPADVRYVLYSHLHLDHAGGMSYFPDAVHVMQENELRYALAPDPWTRPVYVQNDFRDLHKLNVMTVNGDYDLFDDGSFRLLHSPGHSPGMQALMVTLPNRGQFILGGDVAHQREQYEQMVPMPWDVSCIQMTQSRKRMQQLERNGIEMFLCHERAEFEALPSNGEFWD